MARVTLSIPDAMHARIQEDRDGLNFSALAREAFERAFRMADAGKLNSVEETIERLRQSKRAARESRRKEMRLRARAWVRDDASFWQLKVLEDAAFDNDSSKASQLTMLLFGDENPQEAQDWLDAVFGEGGINDGDVLDFLHAVGTIWHEIKDRVEGEEAAAAA